MRKPWLTRSPLTLRWQPSLEAPSDPEKLKGIRRACEIANWCEENLQIAQKNREVTLVRFNEVQAILLDFVADCWAHGFPVQCLVPKGRQMGVTTFWQAFNFALCVLWSHMGKAFRAATIAHIEESATQIFNMSRRFERLLDKQWKLSLDTRQKGHLGWDSGSAIYIVSAQLGDAALKGVTINSIHGSEVANWADRGVDPSSLWTSGMGALVPGPESIVALESTAKGRDPFFHRMIEGSIAGTNPFATVFLPWYLSPEYVLSWKEYRQVRVARGWNLAEEFKATEEEEILRRGVADLTVAPGQEWWKHPATLTDEQLIWRRHKIEELDNRLDTFRRYFPSTLEECFSSTEFSLFPPTVIERLWTQSKDPPFRGEALARMGRASWSNTPTGPVVLWSKPVPGHDYVIGADVSEGLAAGDSQAAYVVDKDTHEVVAAVHCKVDQDTYADILCSLGLYYNQALLAVENNFSPAVLLRAQALGYPRLYWYRDPEVMRGRPARPGFTTTKRSRRVILDVLATLLRDDDLKVWDKGFAQECGFFTWNEREQRFRAPAGKHDDRVMALAIAVYLCGWRTDDGRRYTVAEEKPKPLHDAGELAWKAEQARIKRRRLERLREEGGCVL